MTILVTGAGGQVGSELLRLGLPGLTRSQLDLTNAEQVHAQLAEQRPDLVINAAAYTAVDRAEAESDRAFAVNRDGAGHLAAACDELGILLIHISTDYVFDGSQRQPYREDDPVAPIGVYGESKWQGEQLVRERLARHVILRTGWVFGAQGHNFVKTVMRLATERDELTVVADQFGGPTPARDIARVCHAIADRLMQDRGEFGTFHFGGAPATSWHGLAEAVLDSMRARGPVRATAVRAIGTGDFPTPAARPPYSVLDCGRIKRDYGIGQPDWRLGVEDVIEELLA